jgi:TatD DNase family protein
MDGAALDWFDSHCHLQDEFGPTDGGGPTEPHADRLAATIARAAEAGVGRLVCVGTGAASSAEAVALARSLRRPGGPAAAEGVAMWATVGLHPHDAVDGVDTLDHLLATELGDPVAGADPVVVGIGECGLDYHYDHSPRPVQREAFALQVELARRHDLALVVHTREAWDDTVDVLRGVGVPERTIIHCFTGGPAEARRCLDLGASLSFSGVVTFKNADDVREAAVLCPSDRLLVETDSPFLTPVPHRGSPNEPARVPLVGAAIAHARGVETAEVAAVTTANARRAFGL